MKEKRRVIDKQVITYLVIIAVIIGLVAYASRSVLFRPFTARTHLSAVRRGEYVYVFGGLNRHNVPVEKVLRIDLQERKIARVAEMPGPRYAAAAAMQGETVYIAGGYDNEKYFSDIYAFNTEKHKFTKIGELPEPRSYGILAAAGTKLYYFGGWNGSAVADTIISVDIESGKGEILPGKTEALQFQTGIQDDNRLFIYGGEKKDLEYSEDMYSLDLQSLSVLDKKKLPAGLVRSPAALSGDTLYIAGGWSRGPYNTLLSVDVSDSSSGISENGKIPYNSEDMGLAAYKGDLYLIGGREERFKRQIRIVKIDPVTMESESLLFKSFVWW